MDPLAEDYENVSPYNYVFNNPVNYIDPDGTWVNDAPAGLRSIIVDGTGKIIDQKNDGDNSVYQLVNDKKVKIGTERDGVDYSKLIGLQINQLNYDPNPIPLNTVSVTAKKPSSALPAIGLGLALRTGTLWGAEGGNPEPVTKTIGAISLTAYSVYVMSDAVTKYYYDKKRAENLESRILQAKSSKKSGKEKSSDVPSRARGLKPKSGESGSSFAKRVLDGQYGECG